MCKWTLVGIDPATTSTVVLSRSPTTSHDFFVVYKLTCVGISLWCIDIIAGSSPQTTRLTIDIIGSLCPTTDVIEGKALTEQLNLTFAAYLPQDWVYIVVTKLSALTCPPRSITLVAIRVETVVDISYCHVCNTSTIAQFVDSLVSHSLVELL